MLKRTAEMDQFTSLAFDLKPSDLCQTLFFKASVMDGRNTYLYYLKYYDYKKSDLQHGAHIKALTMCCRLCEKIRNLIQIALIVSCHLKFIYSQKATFSRLLYDAFRFFSCVIVKQGTREITRLDIMTFLTRFRPWINIHKG